MRSLLLTILLILTACSTPPTSPLIPLHETAIPATTPPAIFYLTTDDITRTDGYKNNFWPVLWMWEDRYYEFELPTSSWYTGKPLAVNIMSPQVPTWLTLCNYPAQETWDFEYHEKGNWRFELTEQHFSEWDKTYLVMQPEVSNAGVRIFVEYAAPENYIYATIEPVDCDQIGKGWPFCITFWASNLREVSDFYVWYGIWAEDGGYGGLYAVDHEDYPMGLYDLGVRNQGGEDYDDQNDDSVYAPLGLDLGNTQGALRNVMKIGIDMFRDGHRGEAERYDFLRERREIIEYEAPVYSSGVATWQDGESFFTGQSGALFNTVMSIERPGNYVLYFNVNRPEWPHFVRGDYDVDAVCGPPVMFDVHDTAG